MPLYGYRKDTGIKNYDRPVGEKYIRDNISSKVTPAEHDITHSISVLDEIRETGRNYTDEFGGFSTTNNFVIGGEKDFQAEYISILSSYTT